MLTQIPKNPIYIQKRILNCWLLNLETYCCLILGLLLSYKDISSFTRCKSIKNKGSLQTSQLTINVF